MTEADWVEGVVQEFSALTQLEPSEARRILERHGFELDSAVDAFFSSGVRDAGGSGGPELGGVSRSSDGAAEDKGEEAGEGEDGIGRRRRPGDMPGSRYEPSEPRVPSGRGVGGGAELEARPSILASALKGVLGIFASSERPVPALQAAERFGSFFERRFQVDSPFLPHSFREATVRARAQGKFLLVYLHSPLHQDADEFCRRTLAHTAFRNFVQQDLVAWAGSLTFSEPYRLMQSFKPAAFPFLTLVMCKPGNQNEALPFRVEGKISADALVHQLALMIASAQDELARVRAEQRRREESTHLRQEQDIEFHRALEADRQRARSQSRDQQQVAQEAEAEEEDLQAQAELDAAIELSKKLTKEANLKRKRESLQPEPPAGPETTKLRFQFPNGSKIDRRFLATQTTQDAFDFVDVYMGENELSIESYSLATNYPRRVLEDKTQTLQDAVI